MGTFYHEIWVAIRDLKGQDPTVARVLEELRQHGVTIEPSTVSATSTKIVMRLSQALDKGRGLPPGEMRQHVGRVLKQALTWVQSPSGSPAGDVFVAGSVGTTQTPAPIPLPVLRPPVSIATGPTVVTAVDNVSPSGATAVPPAGVAASPTPLPSSGPSPPPPAPAVWQEVEAPAADWCPPELREPLADLLKDFDYRDVHTACTPALPGWRVLAGTRRGRLHAHHGTHREDAFFHAGDAARGFWVACACDGAGSSRLSRIGSEVTARFVVRALSLLAVEHAEFWRDVSIPVEQVREGISAGIVEAVRGAADRLKELAVLANAQPKDFRCTLLLTLLLQRGAAEMVFLSKVGDGFVAGLNQRGEGKRYDPPQAGGFSGEVDCFVPDAGCVERAKPFACMPDASTLHALLLCTDGIEDPCYPVEANAPALFGQLSRGTVAAPLPGMSWEPAVGPVLVPDPTEAQARLADWLNFEKKGENDDRTLLVLHRDPLPDPVVPPATPEPEPPPAPPVPDP